MSAHTVGKLHTIGDGTYLVDEARKMAVLTPVVAVCGTVADARRLKACWNAFGADMSTEDIEAMGGITWFKGEPKGELAAALAARDLLRAELDATIYERDQMQVLLDDTLAVAAQQVELVAQLRHELAAERDTIAALHTNYDDLRSKWDEERSNRAADKAGAQIALDRANERWHAAGIERDAARAMLHEVYSFASGAPAPVDSATCHTLSKLGEKVGRFLNGNESIHPAQVLVVEGKKTCNAARALVDETVVSVRSTQERA